MKPCSYPGCRNLVERGRCARHKRPGRERKQADPFYKKREWYRAREMVLKRDGHRCVECQKDVSKKGEAVVDHIIPLKEQPHLGLELTNLRTLCRQCDNKRHGKDKGGFRPAPVRIRRSVSKDWSF